jgi:hypothetical protein
MPSTYKRAYGAEKIRAAENFLHGHRMLKAGAETYCI